MPNKAHEVTKTVSSILNCPAVPERQVKLIAVPPKRALINDHPMPSAASPKEGCEWPRQDRLLLRTSDDFC